MVMKERLSFETDAAIIDRLGRELVAKQETALIELIKNSFDADATEVDVVLQGLGPRATLEIRDDGTGMTRAELLGGFLRLASDLKVQSPTSSRYRRRRAGRKGIGRFATQRLGQKLVMTSRAEGDDAGLQLTVDWSQFVAGQSLAEVGVDLEQVARADVGTTIHIERLRDEWSDAQIRRCWRGVLSLQQPFPVAPVKGRPGADPGFRVRFFREGEIFKDEAIVADLQTEILDYLHAVVELKVDERGNARWRISKNRLGHTRDWARIDHEHRDAAEPSPYAHLKNAWMKAHYAILTADLLPSLVFTRVRDVLSEQGGIRLYRNGFRVIPYGDPGNDWLQLDEIYAKRSLLAPLANRNFFGVIEVNDPNGSLFEEHTSREGLIETPAFLELKALASAVLVTAATRISEDRGRKPRAGSRTRPKPSASGLDEISAAILATKQAVDVAVSESSSSAGQAASQQAATAVRLIEEKKEEYEAARAQLADEAAILRFLATLGMTTAEFSHETGMTFDAFRIDFDHVFDAAVAANSEDSPLIARANRARGMLSRLDTLTSYLNALAGARAARGMRPISLSKALNDFARGIRAQAESQNIALDVRTPPYDPLFTRPMHEAEVASILLNFYTNSVKALKRTSSARRILAEGDRLTESAPRVRLRFSDTGDGIKEDIREQVFDAFFTTRVAPPAGASDTEHATGAGLGLWIVRQIVNNAGGEVTVSDPSDGYATCFEVLLPPENAEIV
jgi:signal transduction histidine kinase